MYHVFFFLHESPTNIDVHEDNESLQMENRVWTGTSAWIILAKTEAFVIIEIQLTQKYPTYVDVWTDTWEQIVN